jgi:Fe-S-cluster-containing dehydrogenase component
MVLRRLGKKEYMWRKGMKDYVKEYRASDLPQLKSLSHISSNAVKNKKYIKLHDEASLCQWCHDAPCQSKCPYDYDIRGILRRIEVGNYEGAYSILKSGSNTKKSGDIYCIDCPADCYEACKKKIGEVPPVEIKNVFVDLARIRSMD